MHEWYAAPMEGLTGWRWRQVQHEMFGGAALYVTPFVSPNGNFSFQRKELEEMDPERNRGIPVVPQILTNRAEYFVWAAKECRSRGRDCCASRSCCVSCWTAFSMPCRI